MLSKVITHFFERKSKENQKKIKRKIQLKYQIKKQKQIQIENYKKYQPYISIC